MKRIVFAAALAAMCGLGANSTPVRAGELAPPGDAALIRTGGDYAPDDGYGYCNRYPYRCRERSRYDDDRRYWDDEWRYRRWKWREWERERARWWRNTGRREFCWRHPDHWRCYRDDHH